MNTRPKGSRNNLRGPAQLELFPREVLAQPGGQRTPLRTSHGHAVVQPLLNGGRDGKGGADVCQLVVVWHDRTWRPARFFKRSEGVSVVVFEVDEAV